MVRWQLAPILFEEEGLKLTKFGWQTDLDLILREPLL